MCEKAPSNQIVYASFAKIIVVKAYCVYLKPSKSTSGTVLFDNLCVCVLFIHLRCVAKQFLKNYCNGDKNSNNTHKESSHPSVVITRDC